MKNRSLNASVTKSNSDQSNDWLTGKEVVEALRVPSTELPLLRLKKKIRFRKKGSGFNYRKADVQRILSGREKYVRSMVALLRKESKSCPTAGLVLRIQPKRHPLTAYPHLVFNLFESSLPRLLKQGEVLGVVRGRKTASGWMLTASPLPHFTGDAEVARFLQEAVEEHTANLNMRGIKTVGHRADLN